MCSSPTVVYIIVDVILMVPLQILHEFFCTRNDKNPDGVRIDISTKMENLM
jgi:hypothetical protein